MGAICCCAREVDKLALLRKSPLGICSTESLEKIVKYLDHETFYKGDVLYSKEEAESPRNLYLILSGVVEYKYNGSSWYMEEGGALGFEFLKESGEAIAMTVTAQSRLDAFVMTIDSLRSALQACEQVDQDNFHDIFPLHLKLKAINLFATLQDDELKLMAAVSIYRHLEKDEILVEEGVSDTCLHVVLEGTIIAEANLTTLHRMTVHGKENQTSMLPQSSGSDVDSEMVADDPRDKLPSPRGKRHISTIEKGQSTGAAYFMTQMPHLTSLVAESPSLALSISKDHFAPVMKNHPETQPILEHDCGEQIARALQKFDVPFFSVLNEDILTRFAQTAKISQFGPDEIIMRQGEMGATFYILISGKVGCFVAKTPSKDATEMSRTSGKLFLEPTQSDLTSAAESTASLKSEEAGSAESSPKQADDDETDRSSIRLKRIQTAEMDFLNKLDRSPSDALIDFVSSPSEAWNLDDKRKFRKFDRTSISREFGDQIQVQDLEAGSYFGEIGLLQEVPRSATIIALQHCVVLEFTKADFEKCLVSAPSVRTDFKIKLAEYHCILDDFLEHDMGQRYFHHFLQNEYSSENLEFYIAIEAYKEKYEAQLTKRTEAKKRPHEDLQGYAENIYRLYIESTADKMVNLKGKNKKRISKDIKNGTLTPGSFKGAQEEIKKLMDQDSFQRFKKSAQFRDFLYETNSYVNVANLRTDG